MKVISLDRTVNADLTYRVNNNRTDQYSDTYILSPEHAIFVKLISLDRTVNVDLTYS